jgi:ubiquinone/menaquinone biosynthesis C-methylase UbiE
MDPLAGSPWSSAATVDGFARSSPNATLMRYAEQAAPPLRILDIGCGAGRNAVPLAHAEHRVIGTDLSLPMLQAAAARVTKAGVAVAMAPMDVLPVRDRSIDLIIAHGIWNLARSDGEFRRAIREAARVARPGARLFVFTFSRRTLPAAAVPLAGNALTYTQFSGHPQIFLTADQLRDELRLAGFSADPALPLRELNVPAPSEQRACALRVEGPVIFEGGFRFSGA